jgi:hypothetical protein
MADVFDDDEFDTASEAFVKTEHLLGRLLLVTPISTGERKSTMRGQEGTVYEYVESTVIVLDGDVTDLIDKVPAVLDGFQFSGATLNGQLKPKIRGGKRVLGRLGQKKSETKGFGPAWVLTQPTDEDKVLARTWIKAHPEPDKFE